MEKGSGMAVFETLEMLSEPGDPAKPNDDALCFMPHMAAVLDGATGLGEPLMPGESDAAWIAHLGAERLVAHAPGAQGRALLRAALVDVEAAFLQGRRRAPLANHELPLASLMMVECAGQDMLDAHWFGDCCALAQRPGEPVEVVGEAFDKRANEARGAARLAAAAGVNPAGSGVRPDFLAALRAARDRYNTGQSGVWVFAPDPACADHSVHMQVRAPQETILLLASDGFLALASDYDRYTPEAFVAAACTRGLRALSEELRTVERADAEGLRYPRFKTSDDATAMLLRVG